MFFNSIQMKSLEAGIAAANLKQKTITQNIANVETPGYKAKNVEFKMVLNEIEGKQNAFEFSNSVSISDDNSIARMDGNNVNIEKEQLALWDTYYQYSALITKLNGQFSSLRNVMSKAMK